MQAHSRGYVAAVVAYAAWGLLPLYFARLAPAGYADILEHRIIWSAVLLSLFLLLRHRAKAALAHALRPKVALAVAVSGLLIGSNWLFYAYAVLNHQTLEASLAYFINPLITALLGRVFFDERLERYHVAALACGVGGVAWQLVFLDHVPWIALVLAVTFALYGISKKTLGMPPVEGLWLETLVLLPVLALLGTLPFWQTKGIFFYASEPSTMLMLIGLGITTTVPLILFSSAAQRLPLVAMALLQYISPSLKFIVAVAFLGEALTVEKLPSYLLVWLGVGIFVAGTLTSSRAREVPGTASSDA